MGNIKYVANLLLGAKDMKASRIEPKIVEALSKVVDESGKPLIKRVRLKIDGDTDKGDCTLVINDSFDRDLMLEKLDARRQELFRAFEDLEEIKKVNSLEPQNPKDEG